jgi:GcrA cell cycle regulator
MVIIAFWTPDKDEQMLSLLKQGATAAATGKALGITRNSVIGRTMRLGLKVGELNGYHLNKHKPQPRRDRPRLNMYSTETVKARPTPRRKRVFLRIVPKPGVLERPNIGISIMQLNDQTCRWPMWATGAVTKFYCGEPVCSYGTYCEDHFVVGTTPAKRQAMREPARSFTSVMVSAKSPKSTVA